METITMNTQNITSFLDDIKKLKTRADLQSDSNERFALASQKLGELLAATENMEDAVALNTPNKSGNKLLSGSTESKTDKVTSLNQIVEKGQTGYTNPTPLTKWWREDQAKPLTNPSKVLDKESLPTAAVLSHPKDRVEISKVPSNKKKPDQSQPKKQPQQQKKAGFLSGLRNKNKVLTAAAITSPKEPIIEKTAEPLSVADQAAQHIKQGIGQFEERPYENEGRVAETAPAEMASPKELLVSTSPGTNDEGSSLIAKTAAATVLGQTAVVGQVETGETATPVSEENTIELESPEISEVATLPDMPETVQTGTESHDIGKLEEAAPLASAEAAGTEGNDNLSTEVQLATAATAQAETGEVSAPVPEENTIELESPEISKVATLPDVPETVQTDTESHDIGKLEEAAPLASAEAAGTEGNDNLSTEVQLAAAATAATAAALALSKGDDIEPEQPPLTPPSDTAHDDIVEFSDPQPGQQVIAESEKTGFDHLPEPELEYAQPAPEENIASSQIEISPLDIAATTFEKPIAQDIAPVTTDNPVPLILGGAVMGHGIAHDQSAVSENISSISDDFSLQNTVQQEPVLEQIPKPAEIQPEVIQRAVTQDASPESQKNNITPNTPENISTNSPVFRPVDEFTVMPEPIAADNSEIAAVEPAVATPDIQVTAPVASLPVQGVAPVIPKATTPQPAVAAPPVAALPVAAAPVANSPVQSQETVNQEHVVLTGQDIQYHPDYGTKKKGFFSRLFGKK